MKATKQIIGVILSLCFLLSLTACEKEEHYEEQIFAMDTIMLLSSYGSNSKEALKEGTDLIKKFDDLFSNNKDNSDISKINGNAGEFLDVTEDTIEMIKFALEISNKTQGLFDISIYPLVKAWGFDDKEYKVPTEEEIDTVKRYVNYKNVSIDRQKIKIDENMGITLGAIAKGYTSQKLVELFKEKEVKSAMFSLGGNVQVLGYKPNGDKWKVGIRDPLSSEDVFGTVKVADMAVVTSGGYERYFEENGKTYHHILNPKTGYPADNGLISVTIISQDGILADALSTALFILGLDEALNYYNDYGGFEAVFVTGDKRVVVTGGLKDTFEKYETKTQYNYEFIEK